MTTTAVNTNQVHSIYLNDCKLAVTVLEHYGRSPLEIAMLLQASQAAMRTVRDSDPIGLYLGEWKINHDHCMSWSDGFIVRNLRKGRTVIIDGLNKLVDLDAFIRELPPDLSGKLVLMVPQGTVVR